MTGRWGEERRLDWLDDRFGQGYAINRADLVAYFGISQVQASVDIRKFLTTGASVVYDTSRKAYVVQPPYHSVRGSTEARRRAWEAFT